MIEKKRIVHILNELLPSGAEKMLYNAVKEWEGLESYILATKPQEGEFAIELRNVGYKVHHIYDKNFLKQHCKVRRFLKENKIDIVHIHRESQSVYYALDAKIAAVKNVVRTVHSTFAFTGILRVRRIITRFIERCLGVVYVSIGESITQNEKNRFYNECKRQIRNWCDARFGFVDEAKKQSIKKEYFNGNNFFTIVSVGNCEEVKNHILFIEAFEAFISQLRSEELLGKKSVKYIHVGSGSLEKKEKELVNKLQLEQYIEFWGRTDPLQALSMADLYVMTSSYEGVSIAALEALQTGTNVLLSDVVGLRDFRLMNSSNIHYTKLDKNEIVQKLISIYKDFCEGILINSKELSKKTIECYNMQKSIKEYQDIYNKLR